MAFVPQSGGADIEIGADVPGDLPTSAGQMYYAQSTEVLYVAADDGEGGFEWWSVSSGDRDAILEQAGIGATLERELADFSPRFKHKHFDGSIITMNADPVHGSTVNALVDKLMRVTGIWIPDPTRTIGGVKWFHASTATYTAANNNRVGIMAPTTPGDYSELSLYASCANDANLWKPTINTTAYKAFSSAWTPENSGFSDGFWAFVVALHCNSAAGTAPQIMHVANLGGATYSEAFTGSPAVKLNGYRAAQTDLPATLLMSDITSYAQVPIWALVTS